MNENKSRAARPRALLAVTAALLLAGCASFSPDGGFGEVSQLTRDRTGISPARHTSGDEAGAATQARIDELLSQPLGAEGAVELALLNNRELQAAFADVGVAEADLVRAGRLRNPSFSFGRLSGGGAVEIERAVIFDVLGLLTLPVAHRVERSRFEQAQMQAAYEAVGVAAQARRAYFHAVAAQQLVTYHAQVLDAAEAASELARRMQEAGNFSKLAQMREQSFHADATAQLARARHQAVAERERLVRVLGLVDATRLKLPERLPDLPAAPAQPRDAEQTAMDKRLDVLMARRATDATARSLGLSRNTRFINVLHAGYQNASHSGEERRNGYEIELELPLFDFGSARLARAEATYMQSVHRTAQVALNARSEVREAYSAYRTAYELARHYRDEVVPLRKRISEENLLRYNGMLASVFELLADSREQIASVTAAVEALRDHWVADTQLQTAISGRSPEAGPGLSPAARSAAPSSAAH